MSFTFISFSLHAKFLGYKRAGSACVCWSKISICSLVVLFCNLFFNIAFILSSENHVDVPMNVGLSTSHGEGYENLCMSILQMDLL
jgi:hypothetical protein